MIKSMTGFASVVREESPYLVAATVKTVNHRYLDVQLRLPSTAASIEPLLRSLIAKRLGRGRVELSVSVQSSAAPPVDVSLNEGVVRGLKAVLETARRDGLVAGELAPGDLLRFPQALVVREVAHADGTPDTALLALVESACDEALRALDEMRQHEGLALRDDLERRRAGLAHAIAEIAEAAEVAQQELGERLRRRIAELGAESPDQPTIAQEVVRFVARSDIHEEIVRFNAHLSHWATLIQGAEPSGRRLDFLLQEMNREINTIGSKAEGSRVPAMVVDVKAELERMREQVQNVE
ncbi:MAG: YicC/YloC family endoribonuclease [Vicinamibacterales bacterium]